MRIMTLVTAVLLLAACSQTSLTVSETGEVTAVAETIGVRDTEAVVDKLTTAMETACASGWLKVPAETKNMITEQGMFENSRPEFMAFLAGQQNAREFVRPLEDLGGWLPTHTVTLRGRCDAAPEGTIPIT